MENEPNLTDLQQYFNFILGAADGFIAYGWEDTNTKKFIEGYKTGLCRASDVPAMYQSIKQKYPQSLPNLHITLNETALNPIDGGFRSRKSIKSSRVICLDLDRDVDDRELESICTEYKPALVVESSPLHYHMYWRLVSGGISIKPGRGVSASGGIPPISSPPWTMYQLAFAHKFSGDLNRSDITSTIRVPGFPRLTKQQNLFTPYIVGISFSPHVWTEADLVSRFSWIPQSATDGEKRLAETRKATSDAARQKAKQLRASLQNSTYQAGSTQASALPLPETVTAPGGRNTTIYDYMSTLAFETGLSESEASEQALLLNQAFPQPPNGPGPLPDDECLSAAMNGWRHGIAGFEKRRERSLAVIEPISANVIETKLTIEPSSSDAQLTLTSGIGNVIEISDSVSVDTVRELPLTIDITRTDTSFNVFVSNGNGSFIDSDTGIEPDSSISSGIKVLDVLSNGNTGLLSSESTIDESDDAIRMVVIDTARNTSQPVPDASQSILQTDNGLVSHINVASLSSLDPFTETAQESVMLASAITPITTDASNHTNGYANNKEHKDSLNGRATNTTHENTNKSAEENSHKLEAESLNGAKSSEPSPAKKTVAFSVKVSPYATKINKAFNIPEASDKFCEVLWKHREIALATLLKCFARHSFQLFAELMSQLFTEVGCYTRLGMMISLNRTVEWGEQVTYLFDLQTQNLPAFSRHAILQFTDRLLTHPDTKDLQDNITKVLTDRQLQDITKLFIDETYNRPYIQIQSENLIVFQNGYMDVTTGVFTYDLNAPTTYSNPIMAHYVPDESKQPKTFLRYMEDWFPGDKDIITWMYRWFGYCMTTDTRRQCFAFFFGKARAGKGSLAQLLCKLLGSQNITSIDYDALIDPFRFSSASGKLVITIDEVKATAKQHEHIIAQVKKISGGERVQFNPKFKKPYEEKVTAKMIMQSNDVIDYEDKSHSLRSRLMAVGFERPFIEEATREPSAVILEHDANVLASVAAREYSRAVQTEAWKDCFKFPNSRALQHGFAEVTEHISIDSFICNRYLKVLNGVVVKGQAISELFQLCTEGMEIKASNQRISQFFSEIVSTLGSKGITRNDQIPFGKDKKRSRGFEHLTINKEVLLKEHPELIEDITSLSFKYPHLYEALEISLTEDFVLSNI